MKNKTVGLGGLCVAVMGLNLFSDTISTFSAAAIGGQKMVDASYDFAKSGFPGSGAAAERIMPSKEIATNVVYKALGYQHH